MEDLLFERLERMDSAVSPDVVLQDLYLLDRVVRPLTGPRGDDYRAPFLAEALEMRRFFADSDSRWEAIELYDDVCDLCSVTSYASLEEVLARFETYCRGKSERVASRPADQA